MSTITRFKQGALGALVASLVACGSLADRERFQREIVEGLAIPRGAAPAKAAMRAETESPALTKLSARSSFSVERRTPRRVSRARSGAFKGELLPPF